MRSERNENIDIFKGVGIILVIAGHSIQRGLLGFDNSPVLFVELNKIIELFNMPLCIMFCIIIPWIRARIEDMQSESLRYKICSAIKNYTIFIGKNSLEFYLIEFLFLNIGLKINACVSIVSIFCTCLGISSVAVYMIKKYLKPANAVLFGYFKPLNCLKKL
ncbi:MAG: hypothetical protein LUG91_10830 [Ruminococcus sp.]|nr:hypothetical protein [Ruminococcus sp.]